MYFVHDTSNFSNNCLQADYFTYIFHFMTIPVGQKFTYTKLTVPLTVPAWQIPENDVMALKASDRLIVII